MAILRNAEKKYFDVPDERLEQYLVTDGSETGLVQSVDGKRYRLPEAELEQFALDPAFVAEMIAGAKTPTVKPRPTDEAGVMTDDETGAAHAYCGVWRNFWRNFWRNCWYNCYRTPYDP